MKPTQVAQKPYKTHVFCLTMIILGKETSRLPLSLTPALTKLAVSPPLYQQ